MSQVEALSNVELREALVEFGVSPGPITDSTKKVYISKLERLIAGNTSNAACQDTSLKNDDSPSPVKKLPVRSSPRKRQVVQEVVQTEIVNNIPEGEDEFYGSGFVIKKNPGDPDRSFDEAMSFYQENRKYTNILPRNELNNAEPIAKSVGKKDQEGEQCSSCCTWTFCLFKFTFFMVLLGVLFLVVATYQDSVRKMVPNEIMRIADDIKMILENYFKRFNEKSSSQDSSTEL